MSLHCHIPNYYYFEKKYLLLYPPLHQDSGNGAPTSLSSWKAESHDSNGQHDPEIRRTTLATNRQSTPLN
jgi:hypothetical protein